MNISECFLRELMGMEDIDNNFISNCSGMNKIITFRL